MTAVLEVLFVGVCHHCGTRGIEIVGIVDAREICAGCVRAAKIVYAPEERDDRTESYLRARSDSSDFRAAMQEIGKTRSSGLGGFRRLLIGR